MKPSEIVERLRSLALLPINPDSQDVISEAADLIQSLTPDTILLSRDDAKSIIDCVEYLPDCKWKNELKVRLGNISNQIGE